MLGNSDNWVNTSLKPTNNPPIAPANNRDGNERNNIADLPISKQQPIQQQ